MIYNNLMDAIGNTPLIRMTNIITPKNIFIKLESSNPWGSIKDRTVHAMIKGALLAGRITKETVLVEATSGNTGISLAAMCAILGNKAIIVMPEDSSEERKALITAYGAELITTPENDGMQGSIDLVNELLEYNDEFICLDQFRNPENPMVHSRTTAREILEDMDGQLDYFVAGYGTGGTISGVAKELKEYSPEIQIVAVEPIIGETIPGISSNIESDLLNNDLIDEIIPISVNNAIETMKLLARKEGILAGMSSGAAMSASLQIAFRNEPNKNNIVVMFPDTGERYMSTGIFDD